MRERNPDDERRVLVSPTDKGRSLRMEARHIPQTELLDMTMARKDLEHMRDSVQEMVSALAASLAKMDRVEDALSNRQPARS